MNYFSQILQWISITTEESSSSDHFGGATLFKVQVNFNILILDGQIDLNALEKWLNILEGYLFFHNLSDREKITFVLLKAISHIRNWWETYLRKIQ
jgi:hypothetical protein